MKGDFTFFSLNVLDPNNNIPETNRWQLFAMHGRIFILMALSIIYCEMNVFIMIFQKKASLAGRRFYLAWPAFLTHVWSMMKSSLDNQLDGQTNQLEESCKHIFCARSILTNTKSFFCSLNSSQILCTPSSLILT